MQPNYIGSDFIAGTKLAGKQCRYAHPREALPHLKWPLYPLMNSNHHEPILQFKTLNGFAKYIQQPIYIYFKVKVTILIF